MSVCLGLSCPTCLCITWGLNATPNGADTLSRSDRVTLWSHLLLPVWVPVSCGTKHGLQVYQVEFSGNCCLVCAPRRVRGDFTRLVQE